MVNSKAPVFLFIGADIYSKDKAVEEFRSSILDDSSKELDYRVFHGGESDARDIIDYATTIPFCAARKLVVVKDAGHLPKEGLDRITAYIKKPLKSTCLVLQSVEDFIPREDHDIAKHVVIRRFDSPQGAEVVSWIKHFLASDGNGKSIEPEAIELLKELQGQNLLSINQEVRKLTAFVGNKTKIETSDVEEVVGKSLTASAFDLTGAIEKKMIDKAVSIISELVLTGKKHYEILGLLSWHLKRLMKARLLLEKGEPESRITSLLRVGRRYAGDFIGQVRLLDIKKIRSRMDVLLEADLDIKRTKYDPRLVLEFAVIKLCLL